MISLCDLQANYLSIKPEIDKAIMEVLASGRYVKGPKVEEFEKRWANFCGYKYGVGLSSGAMSLEIAIQVLDWPKGRQIVYNKETFIAIPNAIKRTGHLTLPISHLMSRTYYEDIYAHHHHWEKLDFKPLIEDCSHCHGCRPIGNIAVFSFFPAKILGAFGDAGILLTNNETYYLSAKGLSSHGEGGTNARMDEIQATILLTKLPHLKSWIEKRQAIVDKYDKAFGIKTPGKFHCYYCLPGLSGKEEQLKKAGIEVNSKYTEEEMGLPLYPEMTDSQIKKVIQEVKRVL